LGRRVAAAVAAVVAAATGACFGDGQPGPTGSPDSVVAAAPRRTFATGTAHVVGAAPGPVTASGSVVFATGAETLDVQPPQKTKPAFGVADPVAVLDLLRGVVDVRSFGGSEVQGIGTKHYEVDIDLAKAIEATPPERKAKLHLLDGKLGDDNQLWADVFVDRRGRVRRVLLPVHTAMIRPYGQDQRIPQLVSVDYSDFGGGR
jgi:hypothetical protein